jgi:hypothetical protein
LNLQLFTDAWAGLQSSSIISSWIAARWEMVKGVKQGDKTYTVADWNKMMQSKPTEKQGEKPFPAH